MSGGLAELWDEIAGATLGSPARVRLTPQVSLERFVSEGWDYAEPEMPFIPNWHVGAICEHLTWISTGEIQDLIINIPPGHAKSMIAAVLWPSWVWSWWAGWRSIFTSYAGDLSLRDATRTRDLLTSDWYQRKFQPTWKFTSDQNVKGYYRNDAKGERLSTSVGAKVTGFRGHCVVVDDPLAVMEAHSEVKLTEAARWWDTAMSNRFVDQRKKTRVIIMQRLHEKDLTGHVLAKNAGYVHLMLPSEYEPARSSVTVINGVERWRDPRTKAGELLFPSLFTRAVLEEAKTKDLGTWGFAAQHQQSPLPASGGIFQRDWFRRYREKDIPAVWSETLISGDLTFKKKEDSDFVVLDVWSRLLAACYLRYERRERMGFGETKRALRDVAKAWPDAHAKLIEDKANGPAIIDELRNEIPGLIAVPNNDGVLAQAWAIQPFVEAGNIYIPEGPEGDAWLDEVCVFPKGSFDDRVAAFVQAVMRLHKNARSPVAPNRNEPQYSDAARVANQTRF